MHFASAQDTERRYRVELIVLMHLEHAEEPRERKWLTDYAHALDLLTPPAEDEELPGESEADAKPPRSPGEDASAAPAGTDDAGAAPGEAEPVEDPDPFAGVALLPEPGEEMGEAWRRLRLSGPFRPLQYISWEQDGSEPFPLLRVHDGEIIRIDDPWAEARTELELAPPESLPQPTTAEAAEPTSTEEPALPPPTLFYQLDGTAQLTRSRFLHLDLDIEWRQPVFDPAAAAARPAGSPALDGVPDPSAEAPPPQADHYLVYRLQQRRQVRSGRMEYFDGPVLGVLARITRVRVEAPDTEADDSASEEWAE